MLRFASKTLTKNSVLRLQQYANNSRSFHNSTNALDAKIFGMPAMSPTMESGAVVEWKVKEGDHYNSGDSLLDIETDKATISVDAIDDGILAKIILPNGTKDIKVGTPIAFLAEDGDDLASLEYPEIPSEAAAPTPIPAPEPTPAPTSAKTSAPKGSSSSVSTAANPTQRFFPSVELLLEQNNISKEDALNKIPATGPQGRILKGDVLAYLGKIPSEVNTSIAQYLDKASHLDLSNIELRESKPKSDSTKADDKSSKQKVKEPVVVKESYTLDLEISFPEMKQFRNAISSAISASEQQAYASSITAPSDLDDPLFDDLIAPSRNQDRFAINYKLNTEGNEILSLDLELTLNESCFDAKDRAIIFANSFKDNLTETLKPFQ